MLGTMVVGSIKTNSIIPIEVLKFGAIPNDNNKICIKAYAGIPISPSNIPIKIPNNIVIIKFIYNRERIFKLGDSPKACMYDSLIF